MRNAFPHAGPYADGDDDWRKQGIEQLKTALHAAGTRQVETLQVADRDHGSVLAKMSDAADPGVKKIVAFIQGSEVPLSDSKSR